MERRVRLHEALCTPVMLYNGACAALTKPDKKVIDACHRKHLRAVIGIRWPNKISNEKLYGTCKVRPLSIRLAEMRWKMLGHILRLDRDTPAQRAMDFAFGDKVKTMKPRRGRHGTNLMSVLMQDANERGHKLNCKKVLEHLRAMAADKELWKVTIKRPD